jgi:hypothetical protein
MTEPTRPFLLQQTDSPGWIYLFWKGAPRQILDLARSGTITLFTSPDLLAELADVLGRDKFPRG